MGISKNIHYEINKNWKFFTTFGLWFRFGIIFKLFFKNYLYRQVPKWSLKQDFETFYLFIIIQEIMPLTFGFFFVFPFHFMLKIRWIYAFLLLKNSLPPWSIAWIRDKYTKNVKKTMIMIMIMIKERMNIVNCKKWQYWSKLAYEHNQQFPRFVVLGSMVKVWCYSKFILQSICVGGY